MKINFRFFFQESLSYRVVSDFYGITFLKSFHENRVLWFLHFDYILHIPEYQRDLIRVPYSYSVLDSPIEHVPKMRQKWDILHETVSSQKLSPNSSVFNDTIWPKNEQKSVIDLIITNESMKMNIEKWKPMKIKFKIEMSF